METKMKPWILGKAGELAGLFFPKKKKKILKKSTDEHFVTD